MLSLLRTTRWRAFTAAAVVAIIAFGLLSLWQWNRAEQKRGEFALIEQAMSGPMTPAAELVDPAEWQAVTATGDYVPDTSRLVRNRPQDGSNGFWVVTLLDSEPTDIWVVRGWTPVELAAGPDQAPPAAPPGEVTVEGYARVSQPGPLRAGADLPESQVSSVDVAGLDEAVGTPSQPWFLIASNDPLLRPVPPPESTDSRNLSYAGQWLLFAAVAIGGWFFFLRREALDDRERDGAVTTAVPAEPTTRGS